MAARNSSRGTRRSGRVRGNRPPTHPSHSHKRKPATTKLARLTAVLASAAEVLGTVCHRLEVVGAVVRMTHLALSAERTGPDLDAALALKRCVSDEIFCRTQNIESVMATLRALCDSPDDPSLVPMPTQIEDDDEDTQV